MALKFKTIDGQKELKPKMFEVAVATLRKRGVLGEGERTAAVCCFIPMRMWLADADMEGVIEPTYSLDEDGADGRPALLIEADGELVARVDSRCEYYELLLFGAGRSARYAYVEHVNRRSDYGGSMMFVAYDAENEARSEGRLRDTQ